MNKWKEIWLAYHVNASRGKILSGIWSHASIADRFYVAFLILVFSICIIFHIKELGFWLIPAVASEVALLFKLSFLKDSLVLNEYGGLENSQAPPSTENHQSTRYILFKNTLKEKYIEKSHVNDCFDLIDCQIDIQSTEPGGFKKSSSFVLGILAGILTALWKQLDLISLLYISLGFIAVAALIYLVSSAFPSALEKRKELKYFMLLFCREI